MFNLRMSMISNPRIAWWCLVLCVLGAKANAVEPPKPKAGPLGMKFVTLPKGTTYLGWDGKPGSAKKTEIKEDFEIAVHTVTQGQWQQVMGKNPSQLSRTGSGRDRVKNIADEELKKFPVECVSWDDCQEFIKKLNEQEKGKGYVYRLPSVAEWEYACRGGASTEEECSFLFYFEKPTNDISSKQANFDGNLPYGSGEKGPRVGMLTKVGSYPPNKLGLYDMHGNVWQWTDSLWRPKELHRLNRGGSYGGDGYSCRAAFTHFNEPFYRSVYCGFRIARVPSTSVEK